MTDQEFEAWLDELANKIYTDKFNTDSARTAARAAWAKAQGEIRSRLEHNEIEWKLKADKLAEALTWFDERDCPQDCKEFGRIAKEALKDYKGDLYE